MDITGARWRLRSAEAVLRLRALRKSGDFEEYWTAVATSSAPSNHSCHSQSLNRSVAEKEPHPKDIRLLSRICG